MNVISYIVECIKDKLFAKEKMIGDSLRMVFDDLKIHNEMRRILVKGVFSRSNKAFFEEKIRNNEDLTGWLYGYVADFASVNLSSGVLHKSKGVLLPEGNRLLKIFHQAIKSAIKHKVLNTRQADEIILQVSKNIQEASKKSA